MKIAELKGVSKTYRTKISESGILPSLKSVFSPDYSITRAVNDISFDIEEGEILGFIGPNGAGKSTTLKMLSGILTPTSGIIRVMGLDPIADRDRLGFKIGAVFGQKSQLWLHLPPLSTFRLLGDIYEIGRDEMESRIAHFTEIFGISSLMQKPVRKLSLGERIKCELVATLLHKPKILFLDEPTIGLDLEAKNTIRALIADLNKSERTTIVLTSHDVSDIERLCSRLIIIDKGNIVLQDSLSNIRNNYFDSKIITLKSTDPIDLDSLGVEILRQSDYSASFKVNLRTQDMKNLLGKIAGNPSVEDIVISDISLEEIILRIYRGAKSGYAA
ncbi:MAG: ATP-binding cassette domain-containing protein [Elusimicrobiales bacterium]